MRKKILRYSIPAGVALVVVSVVTKLLALGLNPIWIFLAAVGLLYLLIVLAKYPAMFFVPLLFISQGIALPVNPLRRFFNPTSLSVGTTLLCLALIFRLFTLFARRGAASFGELFRGQGWRIGAFLLWAAVVTMSYPYTNAPNYGDEKLLGFLTAGSLMFFAPFVLLREERDFRHFAIAALAFSMLLAPYSVRLSSSGLTGEHDQVTHIGTGQLMGMAILLVLNYRFTEVPRLRRLLILSLPWLAAGMVASDARGPLLSLLLILLGFMFVPRRAMSLISARSALLGVAVIVAAVFIVPAQLFHGETATMAQHKTQELTDFFEGGSYSAKGSGGRRLVFYGAALDGIREKPLLGWGLGGWASYYWHNDAKEYPHNIFLEVGVEQGLVGVAALVALFWIALKAGKTAFNEASGRFAFVLPMLIYSILIVLPSGDIDDCRFLWFWCSVAFVASGKILSEQRQEPTETEQEIEPVTVP